MRTEDINKKISIILPCYNVSRYLDKCMESLTAQTLGMEYLEIILVNDASTDDGKTFHKLCEWEKKYPDNILVINSEKNLRQGGARNLGFSYATGAYIGYVDPDDYVESDMYEVLLDTILRYHCDIAVGLCQNESEDGEILSFKKHDNTSCHCQKIVFDELDMEERRKMLIRRETLGSFKATLYRRDFIEKNDLRFPEHVIFEDNYWKYFLQYAVRSMVKLEKIVYHYVVHEGSSSHFKSDRSSLKSVLDRLEVAKLKVIECERRGLFRKFYYEIEYEFLIDYWETTINWFIMRLRFIPIENVQEMQHTVKTLFPNYKNNPYILSLVKKDEDSKLLFTLLESSFTVDEWNEFADEYYSIYNGK